MAKFNWFTADPRLADKYALEVQILNEVTQVPEAIERGTASTAVIADFYGVKQSTLDTVVLRNRDALNSDGSYTLRRKELGNTYHNAVVIKDRYYSTLRFSDGSSITVPNRGTRVYSKQAVMRIGLLLRDSEVAQAVQNRIKAPALAYVNSYN